MNSIPEDASATPTPTPLAETAAAEDRAALTHSEFVAAYTSGRLRVEIPPATAAKFVAARMLLPWALLPLFGLAVACALNRAWILSGVFFLAAIGLRALSRATAPGYLLHRALQDAAFYGEISALGLLRTQGR